MLGTYPPANGPMSLALLGTRGVPARYGGFETCVEEVGRRLAERGHKVTVYCRTTQATDTREKEYLGMKLVWRPALKTRTLETLSHSGLSAAHLVGNRTDAAIVFNAANAPWLPAIRAARIPVATHVDGLEWKRAKWGAAGRRYYRTAEQLAVLLSDALIADAAGISDYYREEFDADTELISYGAPLLEHGRKDRLSELDLLPDGYHLVVARLEPENNVHRIIEGYVRSSAALPLIVVGSAPYADAYTRQLAALADSRVRMLGGVWDGELLDQLYSNARVYWHGHSVGGTNPSLLRAIGAGAPVNAYDVNFNREVLADAGKYFRVPEDVGLLLHSAESDAARTRARGVLGRQYAAGYDWDKVALQYEELARRLATRQVRRSGGWRKRRNQRAHVVPDLPLPVPGPGRRDADVPVYTHGAGFPQVGAP